MNSLSGWAEAKLLEIQCSSWNTFLFLMNVSFIWYTLGSQQMLSFHTVRRVYFIVDMPLYYNREKFSKSLYAQTENYFYRDWWLLRVSQFDGQKCTNAHAIMSHKSRFDNTNALVVVHENFGQKQFLVPPFYSTHYNQLNVKKCAFVTKDITSKLRFHCQKT